MREPELLSDAWGAIIKHPAYPPGREIVTAADVQDPELKQMLARFDAMPEVPGPDGTSYDLGDPATLAEVKAGWLRDGWKDQDLWPEFAEPSAYLRLELGEWFADQYRSIVKESRNVHARRDALDR